MHIKDEETKNNVKVDQRIKQSTDVGTKYLE